VMRRRSLPTSSIGALWPGCRHRTLISYCAYGRAKDTGAHMAIDLPVYECTTGTRHCKWPVVSSIPGRRGRLQVQEDQFHRAPELPLAPASARVLRHVPPGRSPHRAGRAQQRPCHPPLACHLAGKRPQALQGSFRGAEQADSMSWLAQQTKSAGDERQRSSHFQSSMHVTCEPKPLAAQLVGQLYIAFMHGEVGEVLEYEHDATSFPRLLTDRKAFLICALGAVVIAVVPRYFA